MNTSNEIITLQKVNTTTTELSAKHMETKIMVFLQLTELERISQRWHQQGPQWWIIRSQGRKEERIQVEVLACYFIFIWYSLPRTADQYLSDGLGVWTKKVKMATCYLEKWFPTFLHLCTPLNPFLYILYPLFLKLFLNSGTCSVPISM